MTEALEHIRAEPNRLFPVSAGQPPATAPAPIPDAVIAEPPPTTPERPIAEPVEAAEPDPVAEAEHYAALYPERAALIRRLGGVPDDVSFGPPDDDLMQALITARTPALLALDHASPAARAA